MEALREQFPAATVGELAGYLKMRKDNVLEAAGQYKSTLAWRATYPEPTIADVAPFLRPAEGAEGPDGTIVCLEDMKGDCARDLKGRPILLSCGMTHGTTKEQMQQSIYAIHRAQLYMNPGEIYGQSTVIEVEPRKGANKTFRFPDKPTRALMDHTRQHYPSISVASTNHFCGVPRALSWGFVLVKPFMAKQTYESMRLEPNFNHLRKHFPESSILKHWGGDLNFDFNKYIAWRAREEGIELDNTLIRRSDQEIAEDGEEVEQIHALQSATSASLQQLVGTHSKEGLHIKMGAVHKQGSGVGMFATVKWKEKLLCAAGGCLVYFDKTEISEGNHVDKFLHLLGAYVEQGDGKGTDAKPSKAPSNAQCLFRVVAPARTYQFACRSEQERADWLKAINTEITTAAEEQQTGVAMDMTKLKL